MINFDEIKKIALLSKLNIADDVLSSYSNDIRAVLDFAKINSKSSLSASEAPSLSVQSLRNDDISSSCGIRPCDISCDATDDFYYIGEENSHDS